MYLDNHQKVQSINQSLSKQFINPSTVQFISQSIRQSQTLPATHSFPPALIHNQLTRQQYPYLGRYFFIGSDHVGSDVSSSV